MAQDQANACVFTHNKDRHADYEALGGAGFVGENIAAGHVTVEVLASLWAEEKKAFMARRATS